MIRRLLRLAGGLLIWGCVATMLAQLIIVAYLWTAWHPSRDRLIQMLALARGIDLFALKEQAADDKDETSPEQISVEEILDVRARKVRHLELREQQLANALDQIEDQRRRLTEEMKRQEQVRNAFEHQLAALEEGAKVEGQEINRLTLEKLKPKQAKEQIMLMLNHDEMSKAVMLLAAMPDTKRAKIAAEFKSDEEQEKLFEILRQIREGIPQAKLAEETRQQLEPPEPTGS